MCINCKTQNEEYAVKHLRGAEKINLTRELVLLPVSYFTGIPPPK
jgi:hypothetical protein